MIRVLYACLKNVTIGNGKGMFPFVANRRYSLKELQGSALTPKQINSYFEKKEFFDRSK